MSKRVIIVEISDDLSGNEKDCVLAALSQLRGVERIVEMDKSSMVERAFAINEAKGELIAQIKTFINSLPSGGASK